MFFIFSSYLYTPTRMRSGCTRKNYWEKTFVRSVNVGHGHIFINKHNALFQFSKNIAVLQVFSCVCTHTHTHTVILVFHLDKVIHTHA